MAYLDESLTIKLRPCSSQESRFGCWLGYARDIQVNIWQ